MKRGENKYPRTRNEVIKIGLHTIIFKKIMHMSNWRIKLDIKGL